MTAARGGLRGAVPERRLRESLPEAVPDGTATGAARGAARAPASRPGDDEAELVRAVQAGDATAFAVLVDRYMGSAYALALSVLRNPHDAEDAVQSAFVRALERIGQLQPDSPFGPWFFRVVRTTSLNLRRREAVRAHEAIPAGAANGTDPEREFDRRRTRERVLAALDRLPEMQRMAVVLYDLEGYSHREVGDILGIAEGTSRAHVHHARRALRRGLQRAEHVRPRRPPSAEDGPPRAAREGTRGPSVEAGAAPSAGESHDPR